MDVQGVTGSPYKHPITRRKLPAPFTRPTISTSGGTPVKRFWKEVSILKVDKGDTVADFGVVQDRVEFINMPMDAAQDAREWRIRLYNVVGDYKDYPGHQRVYAFTEDTNE